MRRSSDQPDGHGFRNSSEDHSVGDARGSSDRPLSADHIVNGPSSETHELKQTDRTAAKSEATGSSSAETTYVAGSKLLLIMVALCATMFLVALVSLDAVSGEKKQLDLPRTALLTHLRTGP